MNEYDVGGVELDAADWRLLEQLQQDASLTNQALAERCHISPPTCLRRVRRLQALGFIERTVSILGGDALRALTGAGLTAIVEVTLDVQAEEEQQQFEQLAVAEPAIQQCYRRTGQRCSELQRKYLLCRFRCKPGC